MHNKLVSCLLVRLTAWSIGCIFYAIVLSIFLEKIASLKLAVPKWIHAGVNRKLGPALGIVSSHYFKPSRTIYRQQQNYLWSSNEKYMATPSADDYSTAGTVAAGIDGAASSDETQNFTLAWLVFSDILSRILLLPYIVLIILVISIHA